MKKVVLLITVLFVSVISTACINNLAVQELNSKAKQYMAAGDVETAICRLRSSIDLDTNIFETHYNLGVALIEAKQFKEAQKSLENAVNLKPDFPDTYYSLALALQEQAFEQANPQLKKAETEDSSIETINEQVEETTSIDDSSKENTALTEADKTEIVEKLNSSIDNYNKYLSKKPNAEDKEKVTAQIEFLTNEMKKYNTGSPSEEEEEVQQ